MRRRILTLALSAACAGGAGRALGQTAQLRGGAWWLAGKDLVRGAGLSASIPLPRRLLLEAHWQRGAAQPVTYLCGFVLPGQYCPEEPLNLNAEFIAADVAYRLPLSLPGPWSGGVRVGAGIGAIVADGVGVLTGGVQHDAGTFPLFLLGVDAGRQIVSALPLRVVGDAEAGLAARHVTKCLDCGPQAPLAAGFTSVSLELGLAWPLGGARR